MALVIVSDILYKSFYCQKEKHCGKRVMLDLYYSLGPAKSLPIRFYLLV